MMAYFCRIYISSEVLTPNSTSNDLFGTKTLLFKIQLHVQRHVQLRFPSPIGQKCSCHRDGTQVLQWFSIVISPKNMGKEICFLHTHHPYLIPHCCDLKLYLGEISGSMVQVTPLKRSHNGPFTMHRGPAGREPAQYNKLMTL